MTTVEARQYLCEVPVGKFYLEPGELDLMFETGQIADFQLVDIREKSSFELYHIKNSVNAPLSEFEKHLDKLDSSKNIILICNTGQKASFVSPLLSVLKYKVKILYHGIECYRDIGGEYLEMGTKGRKI